MYKILKEGRLPVNIDTYGGRHPEDLHRVLNGRIPGDDPFYHHRLI